MVLLHAIKQNCTHCPAVLCCFIVAHVRQSLVDHAPAVNYTVLTVIVCTWHTADNTLIYYNLRKLIQIAFQLPTVSNRISSIQLLETS